MTHFCRTAFKSRFTAWAGGLTLSFFFIWAVSALFCDSVNPLTYDPLLDEYVTVPGAIIIWRSEGWAKTHYGKHGLFDGEDEIARSDAEKIILWGDSQAEAWQVPDRDKTIAIYNALSSALPKGVTRGRSGQSVADYLYAIPRYERAFSGITTHVILLNGLSDVLPTEEDWGNARFRCNPWRIGPATLAPSQRAITFGPIMRKLRLGGFYKRYTKIHDHELRFTPGTAGQSPPPKPKKLDCDLAEGWHFLLAELRKRTSTRIVFLYCPSEVPKPVNGVINLLDPEREQADLFRSLCKEFGMDFIDMTDDFIALYESEGLLPRGGFNSPPGLGHFNRHGHRLMARALHDHFRRKAQ